MNNTSYTPNPNSSQFSPEAGSQSSPKPAQETNTVSGELSSISSGVARGVGELLHNTLPDALRSILGQPATTDLDPRKAQERQSDAEYWHKRFHASEIQRQEEKALIQERQRHLEYRIVQIREQIQQVSESVTKFDKQIQVTTFNVMNAQNSDVYTEHFVTQLVTFLIQIQKRIDKAAHWLALHNKRAGQKGPFFMRGNHMQVDAYQSQERQVSFSG